MTETTKQSTTNSSDEIDLLELLAKLTLTIKRNFLSLVIAFVVGTGLGLAYYQFTPKVYEGKMILMSAILTESYSERITESLGILINEQNMEAIATRLSISVEEASSVSKVEIENLKKSKVDDKSSENSIFIVTVRTTDNMLLPKLQEGIMNYLQNNEFVKIRVNHRKTYLQTMIVKVGEEINSLDSLKRKLFLGQPIYSKSSEMMLIDPTNIYTMIIDLNKEQINLKNSLELVNSIQLVEGFTIFKKPVSPKLSISLAAGASFGLFFVMVLIAIKSLRKIVRLSEEKLAKGQNIN
jgi:phosphotransferase system IIB component